MLRKKRDDYLDGYYAPMTRKGEYQYEGKIYADKANFQIYFTAEKTMDGDLFGVSPYVNSKLMNNNDYVVPVTWLSQAIMVFGFDLHGTYL